MTKYAYCLLTGIVLLLGGCQTIEQISIDYVTPAPISFPESLKKVAIVNNMPSAPDNKLIAIGKEKTPGELARLTNYYNGDARITTEVLATSIANENYFDEVVICDSALRSNDIRARETILSRNEVAELTQAMGVDCLIALENIQISTLHKALFIPEWGVYQGTVDAKVYPTIRVYLPNRNGPMITVTPTDSIFWEKIGSNEGYVRSQLIKDDELTKEASEFAGSLPVKHLLPYWQTATRYVYTGGSVNMRDAAVYMRQNNWEKAIPLWKESYRTKKNKQQMCAAYNLAVAYEMQDSIEIAEEWALKAQTIAHTIDKIDTQKEEININVSSIPNYMITTRYLNALQLRKEGMTRLRVQMKRFEEDF